MTMGPSPGLAHAQTRWHQTTCTITRTSPGAFDQGTGTYTPPAPTTIYSGACSIVRAGAETEAEQGDAIVTTADLAVEIADLTVDVHVSDAVTIAGSSDPLLDAVTVYVTGVERSDRITVRRFTVEERAAS